MLKRRPTRLSTKGAQFIARWEGLRTEPYDDPVGFATIGIGHLLHRSRVTLADRLRWRGFKRTDAYALLVKDAERYAAPLRAFLSRWHVPVNQPQFDALLSFTFNVGPGWIDSSGLRRALIRAGQRGKVADRAKTEVKRELMKWNKAGGRVLPGLTSRREAEARLFTTGKYTPAPKPKPKPPAYVVVDGCPVPRLLAPVLRQVLAESGARLQSCYRGADAEPLLRKLGKQSQRQLWLGWLHRLPGYNPANPPGQSTHELYNDGVAYSQWRRGARIPWWAVGLDIGPPDRVDDFLAAAARHGYKVARTYPTSSREQHHVNFRKPPLLTRLKAHVKS